MPCRVSIALRRRRRPRTDHPVDTGGVRPAATGPGTDRRPRRAASGDRRAARRSRLGRGRAGWRVSSARSRRRPARDRGDLRAHRVRRPGRLRGGRDAGPRPAGIVRQLSRRDAQVDADALLVLPRPAQRPPDRRAIRRVGRRRPARRAHLQRQLPGCDVGRRVVVGGRERPRRLDRRDAHPALAIALPESRSLHVGHQRPAHHPAPQRIGVAAARPQERVRPGVEDGPPRGHRRHRPAHDAGAAALRDGARGVRRAGAAGIAVQRRVAFLRRRRARHEVRPVEQPDAGCHVQSRLRAGGGRPGRRQSLAVRDVLRGAAPVLHRRRQGVRRLRAQRRQPVPGASSGPSRRSTTAAASAAIRRSR